MKKLTLILLLAVSASFCFAQDLESPIEAEAKAYLKHINDVVQFTKEQEKSAMEIYKEFIQQKNILRRDEKKSDKELHQETINLYTETKIKIYELCTEEQLIIYEDYRKKRREELIKELESLTN